MEQVFTFARGRVVEYCAIQNATPAPVRFLYVGLVSRNDEPLWFVYIEE